MSELSPPPLPLHVTTWCLLQCLATVWETSYIPIIPPPSPHYFCLENLVKTQRGEERSDPVALTRSSWDVWPESGWGLSEEKQGAEETKKPGTVLAWRGPNWFISLLLLIWCHVRTWGTRPHVIRLWDSSRVTCLDTIEAFFLYYIKWSWLCSVLAAARLCISIIPEIMIHSSVAAIPTIPTPNMNTTHFSFIYLHCSEVHANIWFPNRFNSGNWSLLTIFPM